MTKKLLTLSLVSGALILTGCGGGSSSDSSTFKGTITKDGVKYTCNAKTEYDACLNNNDCSSCINDAPAPPPSTEPAASSCATNGNTVLVDEGTTCTNGSDTLSCSGNKVTLNGAITGQTININGKIYTCQ